MSSFNQSDPPAKRISVQQQKIYNFWVWDKQEKKAKKKHLNLKEEVGSIYCSIKF